MSKKQAKKLAAEVNAVIHHSNLYRGHSRFIDASPLSMIDGWTVSVENLATGEHVEFKNDGSFRDGHGNAVIV